MSETLKFKAGQREYQVLIEGGLLQSVPERLKAMYPKSRFA